MEIKTATIGYAANQAEQDVLRSMGCDLIVRTDLPSGPAPEPLPAPVFSAFQASPVAFSSGYSVQMTGNTDPGTADFMVEGMAMATALLPNQCLCGNRDTAGHGWEVMLSGSTVYVQGNGAYAQTPSGTITAGVPFHWRVTRKNGEAHLHINGTLLAKVVLPTPFGTSQAAMIGKRAVGTFPFAGSMYKFSYWGYAATYSGSTIGVKYFDPPVWAVS